VRSRRKDEAAAFAEVAFIEVEGFAEVDFIEVRAFIAEALSIDVAASIEVPA
jgi:hypothetical protein